MFFRIIVCEPNGHVKHVIGDGRRGHADGVFSEARFDSPQGLAMNENCLYVCDTNNHAIRCIDLTKNQVTTVAGNGNQCINSQMTSGQNGLDMALGTIHILRYHFVKKQGRWIKNHSMARANLNESENLVTRAASMYFWSVSLVYQLFGQFLIFLVDQKKFWYTKKKFGQPKNSEPDQKFPETKQNFFGQPKKERNRLNNWSTKRLTKTTWTGLLSLTSYGPVLLVKKS